MVNVIQKQCLSGQLVILNQNFRYPVRKIKNLSFQFSSAFNDIDLTDIADLACSEAF